MKSIITVVLLLSLQASFGQWTRVEQLPATDIFNLFRVDTALYAGGRDVIYFSKNNGKSWDSTAHIPGAISVDAFIVYKNEFYAGCWSKGVFKSTNAGLTWQNMGNSILPYVSQFTEWKGNLYAATLGGSMYKLNEPNRNSWSSFNNGLSSLSVNIPAVHGHNNVMLAGTLANRLYDRFTSTSNTWEDFFITGNNSVGDGVYNFISANDSLFMSTHTNIYLSTDDGLTWSKTGNAPFQSQYTPLQNTQQGILAARNRFNGVTNNTDFFYIRKDGLQRPWVPFGSIVDHFAYDFEIIGDKLWEASLHGLNYMSLASLGFTSPYANDTIVKTPEPVVPVGPPPVIVVPFTVGNVYPNPLHGEGYIALSLDTAKEVSATLYDIAGRFISTPISHLKLNKGKTILPFSVGNVSNGTYFLRLAIDDKIFTRKLVHTNR